MLYEYLLSTVKLWIKVLYYIDRDFDKYNTDRPHIKNYSIYLYENELFNKLTYQDIENKYSNIIKSKSCLQLLLILNNIFLLIELYIKKETNIYTFFKLSNIVKIDTSNVNINDYIDYFKINDIKFDIDEKYIPDLIVRPNIELYIQKFNIAKTKDFEESFSKFIDKCNN